VYGLTKTANSRSIRSTGHAATAIVLAVKARLHDLVKKNCDTLVRIPMAGKIASLNVSVATGSSFLHGDPSAIGNPEGCLLSFHFQIVCQR